MVKRKVIIVTVIALLLCGGAWAGWKSVYDQLTSPAANDAVLVLDVSDTATPTGMQKWLELRDLPVSDPVQTALDLKVNVGDPAASVAWGNITGMPAGFSDGVDDTGGVAAGDVLTRTNVDVYTPSADYHPATKKYVDDNSAAGSITGVLGDTSGDVPVLFQNAGVFGAADTAPDVSTSSHWRTGGVVTLVDFVGSPQDNQHLWILCEHAVTFDVTGSGIVASNRTQDPTVAAPFVAHMVYSTSDNQWHFVNAPLQMTQLDDGGVPILFGTDGANTPEIKTLDSRFLEFVNDELRVKPMPLTDSIVDPTNDDDHLWMKIDRNLTVTAIHCAAEGGGTIDFAVEECDANAANCTLLDNAITCDGDGAADLSVASPSLAAGAWLRIVYGPVTGTVDSLAWSLYIQ